MWQISNYVMLVEIHGAQKLKNGYICMAFRMYG